MSAELPTIPEQLLAAFKAADMTWIELLAKTKLDINRTALAKKLRGEIRLNTDEAAAIADALGVTVQWPPTKIDASNDDLTSTDATTAEAHAS